MSIVYSIKPSDMVFNELWIAFFNLYRHCNFFVKRIPLRILKYKVWDLNKLKFQKTCDSRPGFECFRARSGENVILVLDLIILLFVKWNSEFGSCPATRNSSVRKFCYKYLSEIWLLNARFLKHTNIICISKTKESFGIDGHKLNAPLKYFITGVC